MRHFISACFIFAWCTAIEAADLTAIQWQPVEIEINAQTKSLDPLNVDFSATFSDPEAVRYEVPGFWDGGTTWKCRFTPTKPGTWTYRTTCTTAQLTDLDKHHGSIVVTTARSDNALFQHGGILRVSDDKRYLTHTDGTPFFWLGDTWWHCPSDSMAFEGSSKPGCTSTYKTLIDKRHSQGFTTIQMAFHRYAGKAVTAGSFMSPANSKFPDLAYWKNVDASMNYANQAGIVPIIGVTFLPSLDGSTIDEWISLWRYIIARYSANAVSWLVCGEYNQPGGEEASRVPKALALGAFIKKTDPYHRAMSIHPWWYGGEKHQAWNQPWYDFIMIQGAHLEKGLKCPPTATYTSAWNYQPTKPVLEAECNYEGIRTITDNEVRIAAYHAIQAGSFGYTYGAHGLWYPHQNAKDTLYKNWGKPMVWWDSLERPGAAHMQHLKACYESVAWWKLTPRPDAITCPSATTDATRPLDKSDGDAVHLIWFPQGSGKTSDATLTLVNTSEIKSYHGTWFDVRSGKRTDVTTPIAGKKGQCLLPERPDDKDWMLILIETTGK